MTFYYLSYYVTIQLVDWLDTQTLQSRIGFIFLEIWIPSIYRHPCKRRKKENEKKVSLTGAAISIIFVMTKVLLWQTHVMDKTYLLSWQNFCHDETQQTHVCPDKITFVATNICHTCCNKNVLSWQAYFCCDKRRFVVTKIILVAALANNKKEVCGRGWRMKSWAADCVIFIPPPD